MPFTADPDDYAAPLDSDLASQGAAELRALKKKLTDFFNTTGINLDENTYYIEHGVYFVNNNDDSAPVRAAVLAASRTGGNGSVIGAEITGGLAAGVSAGVNDTVAGALSTVVAELGASAGLIGIEGFRAQAIQKDSNGQVYVKGLVTKFYNRGDGETEAPDGLGSNGYNSNSIGLFVTSQARSSDGEHCGWGRGIMFDSYALDDDIGASLLRPVAIDFSPALLNYNSNLRPLPFQFAGPTLEHANSSDGGTYTMDATKLAGLIRIAIDDVFTYAIPIVTIATDDV